MKKNAKQFLILLSLSVVLVNCISGPPPGPVCILFTDNNDLMCANIDKPDDVFVVPWGPDRPEPYVCRPAWYEQAMDEWVKRALEKCN